MGVGDLDVTRVIPDGVYDSSNHTHSDTEESQTTNTCAPASALLINNREGSEEHVESSVDDSHVNRQQEHNWLFEKQNPRALAAPFVGNGQDLLLRQGYQT